MDTPNQKIFDFRKKEKRPVLLERFKICSLPGRFSPFFRSVRHFQKQGKGLIPFSRFFVFVRFRV